MKRFLIMNSVECRRADLEQSLWNEETIIFD